MVQKILMLLTFNVALFANTGANFLKEENYPFILGGLIVILFISILTIFFKNSSLSKQVEDLSSIKEALLKENADILNNSKALKDEYKKCNKELSTKEDIVISLKEVIAAKKAVTKELKNEIKTLSAEFEILITDNNQLNIDLDLSKKIIEVQKDALLEKDSLIQDLNAGYFDNHKRYIAHLLGDKFAGAIKSLGYDDASDEDLVKLFKVYFDDILPVLQDKEDVFMDILKNTDVSGGANKLISSVSDDK